MKITNEQENLVTANLDNVTKFRIKESAKSFQILSSSLYSDTITAIIRELSTNAVDSHNSVGKGDVPIKVHLPTSLESYFGVSDQGIGMDDKDVEVVFCTYFDSTKNDNNDDMGGFGIGGKAPYSYTKNFTITAVKDGIKRLYTAFINDEGLPELARLGQFETTEPNGVDIQVPVKDTSDAREFVNKAKSVFAGFDVMPEFNISEFKPYEFSFTESNIDDVKFYNKSYYSPFKGTYVKMGYIYYPISIESIKTAQGEFDDIDGNRFLPTHFKILESDMIYDAKVGDFDIMPSREGLTYTKSNVKRLYELADKIKTSIYNDLYDSVVSELNIWDKITVFKNKIKNNVLLTYIVGHQEILAMGIDKFVTTNSRWNNQYAYTYAEVFSKKDIADNSIEVYQKNHNDVITKYKNINLHYDMDLVFVYANKPKGIITHVRNHIRATCDARKFVVIRNIIESPLDFFDDIQSPKNVIAQDKLQKPTRNTTPTPKTKRPVNRFKVWYGGKQDYLTLPEDLTTDVYYYVPFESGSFPSDSIVNRNTINDIRYVIEKNYIVMTNIKQTEMVSKLPNWVRIETVVEDKVKGKLTDELIACEVYNSAYLNHYMNIKLDNGFTVEEYKKILASHYNKHYDKYIKVAKLVGYTDYEKQIVKNETIIKNLKSKYPLLEFVQYYTDKKLIEDYINLIDGVTS
jgi:hypothetical protein